VANLSVEPAVLERTYSQLATCGGGRRECVVYWVSRHDDPDVIRRVVHPVHRAGFFGYEVDSDYVNSLFLDLRRDREKARVQVHTHPEGASHSATDDRFALAPSLGFLSLVIPNFALGPPDLAASHLVEMQADGEWQQVDSEATLGLR
jgi:hypothetical protein